MVEEYTYEFGIVTDEDVSIPDLSEYEIINYTRNMEELINN